MKKLLLALGILALICSPAMAGRNANGAMLLHTNDAVHWTTVGLDPCSDSAPSAPLPQTCDELVTTTNVDPNQLEAVVWMVGAFANGSSPAVAAYQVGLYGTVFNADMTAWAACGSVLEIPDAGWPGSGKGTAVTYTGAPNTHQLFKMYWFASAPSVGVGAILGTGAYYAGDHHAEWVDDSNQVDQCTLFGTVGWGVPGSKNCPNNVPVTGACCFANGTCQDLAQDACVSEGGTFEGTGTACSSFQCPPPIGACCMNGACIGNLTEAACTGQGGTWEGFGTDCASFQCPPAIQACCFNDGSCQDLTADQCAAQGGISHPGVVCEGFTCPPPAQTGACCVNQVCTIMTQADCTAAGGQYKGDGIPCNPDTCIPVPTKPSTWGQIKGNYR